MCYDSLTLKQRNSTQLMNTTEITARDKAWRQLRVGSRITLIGRWRRGASGTIEEILTPKNFNGYSRYAVRLEVSGYLADCCRWELRPYRARLSH